MCAPRFAATAQRCAFPLRSEAHRCAVAAKREFNFTAVIVMLRCLPPLMLVLALGAHALCAPESTKPTTRPAEDPALTKQLESIDARAAKVKDFTADFVQEKFTTLLKKPLVSSGQVRVSGPVIRWDTRKPEAAVLYSDGNEV